MMQWRTLRRRFHWLTLAFVVGASLAWPGAVGADVIPQGQKGISYCAGVSNVGEFPDYVVFAYELPQNPSLPGTFYTIADATCQPLRFPTTFYAMKRADFNQDVFSADRNAQRSFLESDPRVIHGPAVTPTRYVSQSDPRTAITTIYRIVSLTESGLAMQLAEQSPAPGSAATPGALGIAVADENRAIAFAWFALLPLVALIAIGVVLLVRRRRRV